MTEYKSTKFYKEVEGELLTKVAGDEDQAAIFKDAGWETKKAKKAVE